MIQMTLWLERYYALSLVLALLTPLWLSVFLHTNPSDATELHDALVWSAILFSLWYATRTLKRYNVRGSWRSPTAQELKLYTRLLLGALLVDFASKAFFFRYDRPQPVEIFKNFGLHSVFHQSAFEPFHFYLSLYFLYLFLLGPLFFRFTNKALDRAWLISCPLALGGAMALFAERLMFGGVHDSFYFAGPLMWLCPTCASTYYKSYAWTPADFFVHALFTPVIILAASYLVPVRRQH
jgi:lipoprotein signal peptidase